MYMIWSSFGKHNYVIQVNNYTLANQVMESDVCFPLKCSTNIDKSKWNMLKGECSPLGLEGSFDMIRFHH